MKKTVSVLLALALCCMLIPATAESESPAGTWYINRAESESIEIKIVNPEAIILTLGEDGTFSLDRTGQASVTGTWTLEGSALTLSTTVESDEGPVEQTAEYRFADGMISTASGDATVYLSPVPAEDVLVLSPVIPAESVEAFNGRWIPYAQMANGLYAEMDEAGVREGGVLVIENGKASTLYDFGNGQLTEAGSYDFTLAEGILSAEDTSFVPTDLTIALAEDGSLLYETVIHLNDENDLIITYIYTLEGAAAEEPAA